MPTALPSQCASVTLAPRQLYSIEDASAVRLACLEGSLWITLDNDVRDWVLEPGESFEAPRHARALLYAIGPVRMDVVALQGAADSMKTFSGFRGSAVMDAAR